VDANARATDRTNANRNRAGADATARVRANANNRATTVHRPVVDSARRRTDTKIRNSVRANANVVNRNNLNGVVANQNNPRHWNNWGRTWNNYGVAPYQRNFYQGSWSGFNGPGFYTPFGFGYGSGYGYGGGYGGGGILGSLLGGYGYGGLGGAGYGMGGYGLNPWLMNSLGYQWGYYGGFNNPYYASTYSTPYNYSQPVYLAYQSGDAQPPAEVVSDFEAARKAFQQGNYDQALSLVDGVIKDNPSDTVAHEFRALTLFALGRYDESAAVLDSTLAVAPGWSWATMSQLYPDVGTYEQQLRKLEGATKDDPQNAASRFLLGYHYLVAGHQDAARRQFAKVVELQPKDRVAQQLLTGLEKTEEPQANREPPPEPKESDKPRFQDGDETELVGHWAAQRGKQPGPELTLDNDGNFTWVADSGNDATKVTGKYEINDQTLVLDGGKNESLVGHLESEGKDRFHFKMLGSPAEDPGLEFERSEK